MSRTPSHCAALVAVALVALGHIGPAAAADVPRPLRAWLHATDSSPTADQLRRTSAHVHQELVAVARDASEHRYARHRAVALLSRLGDVAAEHALLGLRSVQDPGLRATVAVALAAGPGARRPRPVLEALVAWSPREVPEVRAAIARALAMLPAPAEARRAAIGLRRLERDRGVGALLDRVIRAGVRKPSRSEPKRERDAGAARPK